MLKKFSNLHDWNTGRKIFVYENNGELYIKDNFLSFNDLIYIDRWLEIYRIFFGEDKDYNLIKADKKLLKKFQKF